MLHIVAAIDPAVTVSVAAAALGPVGAYMVAARRLSGKISNSDAQQLWEESRAIRQWSTDRLEAQDEEISELRKTVSSLTSRVSLLESEKLELQDELNRARRIISRNRTEMKGVENEESA